MRALPFAWLAVALVSTALAHGQDAMSPREFCVNGGFEDGLKEWVPFSGDVTVDSSVHHAGKASLRCVCMQKGD